MMRTNRIPQPDPHAPGVTQHRAMACTAAGLATLMLVALPLTGRGADEAERLGDGDTQTATTLDDVAAIEALRAQLEAERSSPGPGATPERLAILESIETVTAAALQVATEIAAGERAPSEPDGPKSEPTLSRLAALHDEIHADVERADDLREAFEAAVESRRQSTVEREEAERAARRAARDDSQSATTVRVLEARALLAREQERLARLEVQHAEQAHGSLARRIASLREQAAAVRVNLRARAPGPDLTEFASRAVELNRSFEDARRRRASLDLQVDATSEQFRRGTAQPPELLDTLDGLRAVRDLAAREETALHERLERLETEEQLWSRWHGIVLGRVSHDALSGWIDETIVLQQHLERERASVLGRLAGLRERRDAATRDVADPELSTARRDSARTRAEALRRSEDGSLEELAELDRAIRLASRIETEGTEALGRAPIGVRIARVRDRASALFGIQLTTIDDEPITIGKVLLALCLLILGVVASARASRAAGSVLERRARLEPGVAGAIQSGLFYLLLIAFALSALRTINFPLTAFTVAGGALAIGVGFGSQNVLNNFISGLILMFERPVRSHDLVEVEGTHGTVERIGLRSTRIRAQDGRHIVVPNSFFLETNVVNWTLSDELIRTKLVVGVVYGSDTARVHELLTRALSDNPRVLQKPKPLINFADFGESSLDFHMFFWARSRSPMGLETVMSELRYEIDRMFREAGIVIAFPQHDVHLDSATPVQIALVDRSTSPVTRDNREEPS